MRNVTRRRIFNTALLDQSKGECLISRHNHNVFYKCSLPCEVGFCQLGEILFYLVPNMTLSEFLPKLNVLHPLLAIEFIPSKFLPLVERPSNNSNEISDKSKLAVVSTAFIKTERNLSHFVLLSEIKSLKKFSLIAYLMQKKISMV